MPQSVNDTWLGAIRAYKAVQQGMHDTLRKHILAVFKEYRPDSTEAQAKAFLANKELRKSVIAHWREISIHRMMSEKLLFWEQFRIRSLNFHTLTQDIQLVQQLFDAIESGAVGNVSIREYMISKDGDAMLEFSNGASETHPILRFRVSSHFLAASSSLFSRIFSRSRQDADTGLDMVDDLPPPPIKHTCEDKSEVRLYRMPQFELNDNEALTILLEAAHMHKHEVPKSIDFPTFVSIAEVCLRYRCVPVQIEFQVEFLWLPQWMHMAGDEGTGRDGLLLISYVFGARGIFTRMTKSAILNALDDAEIESKTLWPKPIRDRIKAIRAAKIAQIHTCCINAIGEYFRPPQDSADRPAAVGYIALTTSPRCPRRSHLCDATNLGWLMLVYNELRVLPTIMSNTAFPDLPETPRRSLKEFLDYLRLMPSAPEVHSGVCDYAPALRSAINDIYNSISGLLLEEVGSVLMPQNMAESVSDIGLDPYAEVHELETTPVERIPMSSHEDICLRILSHLDDIDDLNSAALVDKGFYTVYKKNEMTLLKNAMRGERKRTMSMSISSNSSGIRESLRSYTGPREKPLPEDLEPKCLVSDSILTTQKNDLYSASPQLSPTALGDTLMSDEEAHKILYPGDLANGIGLHPRGNDENEKYLLGDVSHIEDKARMGEGYKQLRDEKDKQLGLGAYKSKPPP